MSGEVKAIAGNILEPVISGDTVRGKRGDLIGVYCQDGILWHNRSTGKTELERYDDDDMGTDDPDGDDRYAVGDDWEDDGDYD